jgi:hypothetical protein
MSGGKKRAHALKLPSIGEGYTMNEHLITGCQPDSVKPTVQDERGLAEM